MAEYLSPGVYVEEVDSGIKPMEGVSTSTAGFVGLTERGPVGGTPEFVSSFTEFKRKFGGYLSKKEYGELRYLPLEVEQFFANGGGRCFVVRVLNTSAGAAAAAVKVGDSTITLTAANPGAWGNRVEISCRKNAIDEKRFDLSIACLELPMSSEAGYEESYAGLTLSADDEFALDKALEKSYLVHVSGELPAVDANLYDYFDKAEESKDKNVWKSVMLSGGLDYSADKKITEVITPDVVIGSDNGSGKRTGLCALQDIPEISIVAVPGMTDDSVLQALKTHCELMGNRIGIMDMPSGMNSVTDLKNARLKIDSSYAAMYHPWIQVFEPLEKRPSFIPPSGAMAGIYARVDTARGVHKAPANETIRNCTGLETLFGKAEQDMLNPIGVNLIRNIQGQGIRVWGARTCSSDSLWKYVNVRRLFIFLEETLRRNTGWAVFEPNDQVLWTKVYNSITSFLNTQWRAGALAGASEAEAYFVNVGLGSTMTQDDVLNGRMICEIGVAPSRPAEFVIFRISQKMELDG